MLALLPWKSWMKAGKAAKADSENLVEAIG
jgi:hypothetical protein